MNSCLTPESQMELKQDKCCAVDKTAAEWVDLNDCYVDTSCTERSTMGKPRAKCEREGQRAVGACLHSRQRYVRIDKAI